MATATIERWDGDDKRTLQAILLFNVLLAVQLLAAVFYALFFDVSFITLHLFLVPFVWISVSILAVWYTDRPTATGPRRLLAAAISGSFFLLFLYLSGGAGTASGLFEPVTGSSGFGVTTDRSLGWSPILFYSGEWVSIRLIPYQLVGYLALSYLMYVAVLDISRSAKAGLLGLALCPGCTVALFSPALASAAGLSAAVTAFTRYSYELSTVLFVLAVGLLYWQPTVSTLRRSATENLPVITAGVALIVAWAHLFHPQYGVFRLLEFLQAGTLFDPRPLLFTLAGLGIFAGMLLWYAGIARDRLALLGIALMGVFLVGYASWHTVFDHGAFWPTLDGHGHHDAGVVRTIGTHLLADGYALASKLAELILALLLVVLYRRE